VVCNHTLIGKGADHRRRFQLDDPGRRERELYSTGEPGLASQYVTHFAELMGRTPVGQVVDVVLLCRVSGWCQGSKGHDRDQERDLMLLLHRRYGDRVRVVGAVRFVGNGSRWDDGLAAAVSLARENGPGTVVLAETPARLLRHRDYHSSRNPDALPNAWQWRDVATMARGVILATILHPDASPARVRDFESRRGTRVKARGSKKAARVAPGSPCPGVANRGVVGEGNRVAVGGCLPDGRTLAEGW
jgi:hypothetical protein